MSERSGELTPIKPARIAQELGKPSAQRGNGQVKPTDYDAFLRKTIGA